MTAHPDVRLVAPYGATGASTRVRALAWFDHLGLTAERHTYLDGGDTRPGTLLRRPGAVLRAEAGLRLLSRRRSTTPLLLLRNATPFSSGGVEERLLRRSPHAVYDVDDALHVQQPGALGRLFSRAEVWQRSVAAADVVVAGSDLLAEAAAPHAREVVVVPTCVAPDEYRAKTGYALADPPRAVWLGSPSTEQYLLAVAPALLAEHRRSGLRVTLVSAGAQPLGELEPVVDRVAWRPGIAEETLADADLGLMPLADSPWERGKCAYKLLQYGAAGLPVVGSPVGANTPVLAALDGYAATGDGEWAEALAALVDEPEERRRRRGETARRAVTEHYSYARWAGTWRQAVLGG